jgi:ribosomal protein S18 acetylase RimI-like enzyme
MRLKIRRYSAKDHPRVMELHVLGLEQFQSNSRRGAWDADVDDIEGAYFGKDGEFLVGELEGEVVAMGGFRRKDERTAEVKRVRVHPGHQRRGFGQAILSELEHRARSLGYSVLFLDTTLSMVPAQKLYLKNGFVEVGREKDGRFQMILYEKALA